MEPKEGPPGAPLGYRASASRALRRLPLKARGGHDDRMCDSDHLLLSLGRGLSELISVQAQSEDERARSLVFLDALIEQLSVEMRATQTLGAWNLLRANLRGKNELDGGLVRKLTITALSRLELELTTAVP